MAMWQQVVGFALSVLGCVALLSILVQASFPVDPEAAKLRQQVEAGQRRSLGL
jgi:hypothetical protein